MKTTYLKTFRLYVTFSILVILVGLVALFSLYTTAFAEEETYLYVNMNGDIATEVADSPEEAILQAEDRAPHSGVMLAEAYEGGGTVLVSLADDEEEAYLYVDIYGNMQIEVADSPEEAILQAENRAEHSGVMVLK